MKKRTTGVASYLLQLYYLYQETLQLQYGVEVHHLEQDIIL